MVSGRGKQNEGATQKGLPLCHSLGFHFVKVSADCVLLDRLYGRRGSD